jgi:hypothetical protein
VQGTRAWLTQRSVELFRPGGFGGFQKDGERDGWREGGRRGQVAWDPKSWSTLGYFSLSPSGEDSTHLYSAEERPLGYRGISLIWASNVLSCLGLPLCAMKDCFDKGSQCI